MKARNPFARLTKFEWGLWLCSILVIVLTFVFSPEKDIFNTVASLIGVTSLILLAKGAWQGQVLMIVFATLYGIISLHFRYYGELITYVGMTLPLAVLSLISWLRHPYKNSGEVSVAKLSRRQLILLPILCAAVTLVFYFLLRVLQTPNLPFSTLSVATSFIAAYLTLCRSPFFALAYALNDAVLVLLWSLAATANVAYLPVAICFAVFFFNDGYGFLSWLRMQRRQKT